MGLQKLVGLKSLISVSTSVLAQPISITSREREPTSTSPAVKVVDPTSPLIFRTSLSSSTRQETPTMQDVRSRWYRRCDARVKPPRR